MLIRDLMTNLDSRLTFSLSPDTKAAGLSRKFGIRTEVGLVIDSEYALTMFFPAEAERERDLGVFLREFEATRKGNYFVIRRKVDNITSTISVVEELLGIPSVVLAGVNLNDGRYTFDMLYHSSYGKEISAVILNKLSGIEGIDVIRKGRSESSSIIREANGRTPLTCLTFESSPPDDETGPSRNPAGNSWQRIVKVSYGSDRVRAVYFKNGNQNPEIFEADTENPLLAFLNERMSQERIMTLLQAHSFERNRFTVQVLIPDIFRTDFLKLLYECSEKFKVWKIAVTDISPVNEVQ